MGLSTNKKRGRPFRDELTALEFIAEHFLAPLVEDHCPASMTKFAFVEQLFGLGVRFVGKFKAKRRFIVPGVFVDSPCNKIPGFGFREVPKDAIVIVRYDLRTPKVYDFSACIGVGEKEHWYEMQREQWLKIARFLEPLDDDAEDIRSRD